ncbi:MAG: hypothetical protein ACFFB0_02830 [Promethearchaeota archaeon]
MHSISKKFSEFQEDNVYIHKFLSKNGEEFGLRLANPDDAESISKIFKEIYNYEYINPYVYDSELLKQELLNKGNFWFVGDLLETNEIGGAGLVEKNKYIARASRMVVRKKFQDVGLGVKMGAAGIVSATKLPQFKDVLRLDGETRGMKIGAQKLIRNAGAIPYGLVPAYLNYGDKRKFMNDHDTPIPALREEAAILYSIIFKTLWKKREKEVYLLDNEDFVFFYDFVRTKSKKMNKDILIFEKCKKNKGYELYGVSRDFYGGRYNMYGYIKEKSLTQLLNTHNNWRIILWRIPTTQNGIYSMSLALEKGFNIVGYDVGYSNFNWTLYDSVIMAYYPNGGSHVLNLKTLDENKPLFNKVREIFFSRVN